MATAVPDGPSSAARILIVDDDVQLGRLLCRFLSSQGFACRAVERGSEALAIVREGGADLLISDINMPHMDGIELIMAVGRVSTVPIVAISGGGIFEKEQLLQDARLLGARAVLVKPLDLEAVLAAVRSALHP